jgi:hypothetical protein
MPRKNDRLVPTDLYKSLDDLEIPKESIIIDANQQIKGWIETKLNKGTLTEIRNAWVNGIIINIDDGQIWLNLDYVHSVLRTDKVFASKWVIDEVEDKFKIKINGTQYVSTVALVASLHQNMSRSNDPCHRAYKEFSWKFLTALRDSPQIKELEQFLRDKFKKTLKPLKQKRIKQFNITKDELTGKPLEKRAEFAHICCKSMYPELALYAWNGLIVNPETHKIITKESVLNADDLLSLCQEKSWNTSWAQDFIKNLRKCGYYEDFEFFKNFTLK